VSADGSVRVGSCSECHKDRPLTHAVVHDAPMSGPLRGCQLTRYICQSCALALIAKKGCHV
jgi:DDE family transposase